MKKSIITIGLLQILVFACGKKEESGLEGKKTALAALKSEKATIEGKISTLESEIALLDTSAKKDQKIKQVSATTLAPEVFRHFVSVQGSLEADENVMVTSKIPGLITSIKVRQGDVVKQGQILAILDDEVLQKSIDEVKVGLSQIVVMYDKQKALWDQKIGTEMQYLNLKNQKESLEKKLITLKSQVSQTYVTAPFSGVIDEIFAKQGSPASPGIPLMQLVNVNVLKAIAKVPDSYVSYIKEGDKVNVLFPDLDKTISATVSYVGRIVDPLSRTFKIEVKVPGGNESLKPNLLAMIQINDKTSNAAIVIQENIVQSTEDGKIVFVTAEEKGQKIARQKTITTGLSYNGKVEILSGLTSGESLITTGYQDLADNQPISY
jgi:membrane fusion protein (multidrug efflux system)